MSPNPERLTFGVEVEFFIAALLVGETPDPHRHVEGLPPVLRLPAVGFSTKDREEYTFWKIRQVIDKCFGLCHLEEPPVSVKVKPRSRDNVWEAYGDWMMEADGSIFPPENTPYRYMCVEIASPIQYACPKGFDAINLAISAITSKFRCMINLSCGMHVHVGTGEERLSLEQVRRMASLSYAVEPLLFTLHHPLRKVNGYCKPIRYFTNLARDDEARESVMTHGREAHSDTRGACLRYLGLDRRHGELPMSAREENDDESCIDAFSETRKPGNFEPFTKPDDTTRTKLWAMDISHDLDLRIARLQPLLAAEAAAAAAAVEVPTFRRRARVKLPGFDLDRAMELSEALKLVGADIPKYELIQLDERGPGPGVFRATETVYGQPASCGIARKLSAAERPAINFAGYLCLVMVGGRASMRTVEFRLGESSLDGHWVATWARICVGLSRFALYASPGEFIDLLTKCDRADKEEGAYDVVDLIADIGLFAEAEIAERRLWTNRLQWKLKFTDSECY